MTGPSAPAASARAAHKMRDGFTSAVVPGTTTARCIAAVTKPLGAQGGDRSDLRGARLLAREASASK